MAYLDVNPMMAALRTTPEQFEFSNGWYHHIPSRHNFSIDQRGHVRISAACNCSFLSVQSSQEQELALRFNEWQTNYWQPLMINREFASHFQPRSGFRRLLIELTGRMHHWLLAGGRSQQHHGSPVAVPAE